MTPRRIVILVGCVGLVVLSIMAKDRVETLERENAELLLRLSEAEERVAEIDKDKKNYATVGERIEVIETPLGTLTRRVETLKEIPLDYEYLKEPAQSKP